MPQHRPGQVITRPITRTLKRRLAKGQKLSDLTGFSAGTLVLTLDGALPVEHLVAGDRVVTRSGARILTSVTSQVVRGAYTIDQHTLGHDKPEAMMALGPRQEILLRDWRARALYDRDQALVPVARIADGDFITPAEGPVRLFQLEFAQEEIIYAGGLECAVPGPS